MTGRMEGTSEKEVCILYQEDDEIFRGTDAECYSLWQKLEAEKGNFEWCMWGSGYRIAPIKECAK